MGCRLALGLRFNAAMIDFLKAQLNESSRLVTEGEKMVSDLNNEVLTLQRMLAEKQQALVHATLLHNGNKCVQDFVTFALDKHAADVESAKALVDGCESGSGFPGPVDDYVPPTPVDPHADETQVAGTE